MNKFTFILLLVCAGAFHQTFACTNFLFTKSTTKDGSTAITYASGRPVGSGPVVQLSVEYVGVGSIGDGG